MLVSSSIAAHEKGTVVRREPQFAHWTCAYLQVGQIVLNTEEQRLEITAPAFLLIPPNLPYEFIVTVADQHLWAIFDSPPRFAHVLEAAHHPVKSFALNLEASMDRALVASMEECLKWWRAEPMRFLLSENALERALLLSAEREQAAGDGLDSRIEAALSYIARNWTHALSVPQLATKVCLSPSRFAALFRQETGTTPARYIQAKRLEAACDRLLNSNASIAEIAESVGFSNAFHFSARFRTAYDQSPRDFRRSPLRHRYEISPQQGQ